MGTPTLSAAGGGMGLKRALDLGCGGGGASMGLVRAGYVVTGVDLRPQPHYPFRFVQADATTLPVEWISTFDLVWASMPCQRWSRITEQTGDPDAHPDLIGPIRFLLERSGVRFILENVPRAPLRRDVVLCGAMFGLRLIRHRAFECHGFTVQQPAHRAHHPRYVTVTGHSGGSSRRDGRRGYGTADEWRDAMGIDWLPRDSLAQAVPPVYAEYLAP